MDENLQEFVDSRGVEVRIDRQQSIIRGVKLLGLESRNGRRYLPAALIQAVALYEGAKVNVNHPKGHPLAARDYQDRLGVIRNASVRGGTGLFGDFHFNPKHAIAEQLLWDAAHAPENVGFSHNVEARTSRHDGQIVVEAILKVQSVDLVADPATTRGLYESSASVQDANEQLTHLLGQLSLGQLRAGRPDLVAAIEAAGDARLRAFEAKLDQLQAREAVHERRALAVRLLKEFKLPDPAQSDIVGKAVVSEWFFETLLAAPDEPAMRALVRERAEMIAAARRMDFGSSGPGRPTSREQYRSEPTGTAPLDVMAFAKAIL